MARISVVLPAPLGPSTPMNSPGAMAKLTSDRTLRPPIPMVALVEFDDIHEDGPASAFSVSLSSLSIQS